MVTQPPELNRRARSILQAVVSEYLESGEAVGSRTITRRHAMGLSSATVRNVMVDLEELGLLSQPHTSAGRMPTATGLRFFIDAMVKVRGLSARERDDIRERITGSTPEDVASRASRLLSDLTQHAAVIITPDPAQQRFSHIEFVPLRSGQILAVLVTADGRLENRLITAEHDLDATSLERIHNYLNELLSGLTLDEVRERLRRELREERIQYDAAAKVALQLGEEVFSRSAERSSSVVVSGHANLIGGELGADVPDPDRMRSLLRTLEDKEALMRLLDRTRDGPGIHVFLGAETASLTGSALIGSSVVAVGYGPDESPLGALAVIGPQRMNYAKVMSVVDCTAELITEILGDRR